MRQARPIWNASGAIVLPALLLWLVLCLILLSISALTLRAQKYTAGIFRTEVCALKIAQIRAHALADLEKLENLMQLPRTIVIAARAQTLVPGIGIISIAQAEVAKKTLETLAHLRELKLKKAQTEEYIFSCQSSQFSSNPAICDFTTISRKSFTERAAIFPDLPKHWERTKAVEKSEFFCQLAEDRRIQSKAWLRTNSQKWGSRFEISLAPFLDYEAS